MKYYIAYGSNMNTEQMAFRCPAAKQAQTAMLPDYRLEFRGARDHAYLTITPEKGGRTDKTLKPSSSISTFT